MAEERGEEFVDPNAAAPAIEPSPAPEPEAPVEVAAVEEEHVAVAEEEAQAEDAQVQHVEHEAAVEPVAEHATEAHEPEPEQAAEVSSFCVYEIVTAL